MSNEQTKEEYMIETAFKTLRDTMAMLRIAGGNTCLRAADLIEPVVNFLEKLQARETQASRHSLSPAEPVNEGANLCEPDEGDVAEDGPVAVPSGFEGGASASDDAAYGLKPAK